MLVERGVGGGVLIATFNNEHGGKKLKRLDHLKVDMI
jgi:hypothetical protein